MRNPDRSAAIMVAAAGGVLAALAAPAVAQSPAPTARPDDVTFTATMYLWATSLSGRTSTIPPLPATDVSVRFADVFRNLDGAFMGAAELRTGRFGVWTDLMWSRVEADGKLPAPFLSKVTLRSQTITWQTMAAYRIVEHGPVDVDVTGGFRWWALDNKVTVAAGWRNPRLTKSTWETWVDPVVGARASADFGSGWSATLMGDIGGFGAGSDFSWQALGSVNYDVAEKWRLRAGYRYLSVDYSDNRYEYDVDQYGPIIGVAYRF